MAGNMDDSAGADGWLDGLPLSRFQVHAVLMVAATVVLDGLDNQMLGLAAPSLIKEWGIQREALGFVFALGFVGMALGTLVAGHFGDLVGRRGALLGGVGIFGIATLLTGFSDAFWQVGVLKVVAGIGLGGVPESLSYLAARPERHSELEQALRKMKHPAPDVALAQIASVFSGKTIPLPPFSALLKGSLLRDSMALSLAMFSGMFMIYIMFNWAPTLLFSQGYDLETASLGLTSFNIGGTVGAIGASFAILRFGSRPTLILMAATGAVICAALAVMPMGEGAGRGGLLAGLAGLGLFASAAQSAMFAVGVNAFPTAVRARGLGLMGAAGRLGAIFSALAGAWLIGAGNSAFFGALIVLMLINCGGFIAVRQHVPSLSSRAKALRSPNAEATQ